MAKSKNSDNEEQLSKDKSPIKEERRRDWKENKDNSSEKKSYKRDPKQNGSRLYVENIDVSNRELEKLFSKFGPILEAWSVRNSPRYAFVLFKHKDDAAEAIDAMNGFDFQGRKLKVSYALPRSIHEEKKVDDTHRNTDRDRKHSNHDSSDINSDKRDRNKFDGESTRYSNHYMDRSTNRPFGTNSYPDMRLNSQRCFQCGRMGHLLRQCWDRRDGAFFRGRGRRPSHPYSRSLQAPRVANMLDDLTDIYADAKN